MEERNPDALHLSVRSGANIYALRDQRSLLSKANESGLVIPKADIVLGERERRPQEITVH